MPVGVRESWPAKLASTRCVGFKPAPDRSVATTSLQAWQMIKNDLDEVGTFERR